MYLICKIPKNKNFFQIRKTIREMWMQTRYLITLRIFVVFKIWVWWWNLGKGVLIVWCYILKYIQVKWCDVWCSLQNNPEKKNIGKNNVDRIKLSWVEDIKTYGVHGNFFLFLCLVFPIITNFRRIENDLCLCRYLYKWSSWAITKPFR